VQLESLKNFMNFMKLSKLKFSSCISSHKCSLTIEPEGLIIRPNDRRAGNVDQRWLFGDVQLFARVPSHQAAEDKKRTRLRDRGIVGNHRLM